MIGQLTPIRGRVFVDTGAYFSVSDERDENHPLARALAGHLATSPATLFTTNFILAETHVLALSRRNRRIALQLIQEIRQTATTIVRVSVRDEMRALEILTQFSDKNFSYTDATSFAVMERLHIQQAFSFDRNFSQYGLRVLPAEGHR